MTGRGQKGIEMYCITKKEKERDYYLTSMGSWSYYPGNAVVIRGFWKCLWTACKIRAHLKGSTIRIRSLRDIWKRNVEQDYRKRLKTYVIGRFPPLLGQSDNPHWLWLGITASDEVIGGYEPTHEHCMKHKVYCRHFWACPTEMRSRNS